MFPSSFRVWVHPLLPLLPSESCFPNRFEKEYRFPALRVESEEQVIPQRWDRKEQAIPQRWDLRSWDLPYSDLRLPDLLWKLDPLLAEILGQKALFRHDRFSYEWMDGIEPAHTIPLSMAQDNGESARWRGEYGDCGNFRNGCAGWCLEGYRICFLEPDISH